MEGIETAQQQTWRFYGVMSVGAPTWRGLKQTPPPDVVSVIVCQ